MTELSLKHLATVNYTIYISRPKECFKPSLLEDTHLIGDAIFKSLCLRDGRHENGNHRQLSHFLLQALIYIVNRLPQGTEV